MNKFLHSPTGREDCWLDIAKQHPEFFRISEEGSTVALTIRAVRDRGKPLEPEEADPLLSLAVTLHDSELRRFQQWVSIGSLIIGVLTLAVLVVTGILF